MRARITFPLLLVLFVTQFASAEDWAAKLFKTREHDFGAVARGAEAEFRFEFENTLNQTVRIRDIRSSCGCTTPKITERTIAPGETSSIVATYNTRSFLGKKGATITVLFDRPTVDEVQLNITGYIRSDIVFHPGEVALGEVDQADTAEQRISIKYAGRSDWQIVDVQSENDHFEVELIEKERAGTNVGYEMIVRLTPGSAAGFFRDQLTIVTDDPKLETVQLNVHGNVLSPLTVSPSSLFLGVVEEGKSVTKQLVVRGKEPFKVVGVSCENEDCFTFKMPSETPKKLHFIPITFTAGPETGKIAQRIQIKTDLGDGAIASCMATATVRARGAE